MTNIKIFELNRAENRNAEEYPAVQDVQTIVASPDEGRERIEACIRHLLELRATGDVEAMAAYAAPDVVFKTPAGRAHPFHAPREGRDACRELGYEVNVAYENLGSRLNKLLIDGDRVAIHRTARIRNRGAGEPIEVDIWNFLRFRDGLIVEFSEYPDTAVFARLDAPNEVA